MDRRIMELYDEYTHRPLERRVFLERLTRLAGGTAAATALLPLLEPNYANAQQVPADDPRLRTERVTFQGSTGPVSGYLARPAGDEDVPAVILIHENRGLNPHTEDVARRTALAGFMALAPDMLSPLGGTPDNPDRAREMIGQLDRQQTVADLRSAVSWLGEAPGSNGNVGVVGFCWGGGMANALAAAEPELDAAVVFYGMSPAPEEVGTIQAPLLLHYAGRDNRINASVPAYEEALRGAGKRYELHMYEDVDHAFLNDTSAERYDAEAAELAWNRTVEFLRSTLA
jgi:carboxymethylenebutenolidase